MSTLLIVFCMLGACFFGMHIPSETTGGTFKQFIAITIVYVVASLACVGAAIAIHLIGGAS